jgi:hypothetical protein
MNDSSPLSSASTGHSRSPWNKSKIIAPGPPLRPGHVWSIWAKLDLELRVRGLALFNLAIDNKLRGCDLVALRLDDVAPHGYAIDRANGRRMTAGRPLRCDVTSRRGSRSTLDAYRSLAGPGAVSGPRRLRLISDDAVVRAPREAVGCQRRCIKSPGPLWLQSKEKRCQNAQPGAAPWVPT